MSDPQELRRNNKADVYKAGVLAAHITRQESGNLEFRYVDNYSGPPVATTLPVATAPIVTPGGGLPPFFVGLLPEGHRLSMLHQLLKTSWDDELSLLLAIGSDTPGDVQIFPTGSPPTAASALATGDPNEADFRELTGTVDRVGLPGMQAKASASMINIPVAIQGAPSILKIDPPEHPHLVQNEALHLATAQQLKIPVSSAQLVRDKNNLPGLLVQRFDRAYTADSELIRFGLEDAAQVLGILPSRKYAVDSAEVALALMNLVPAPLIAARNIYLQFVFAWLTGNGDLHAKNISVLQQNGTWRIAPIYDIPSTVVYRDMTMALSVSGRDKNLRKRHWQEFANDIGLPKGAAEEANQLALRVATSIDLAQLPFEGSSLYGAQRELRFRRNEMA